MILLGLINVNILRQNTIFLQTSEIKFLLKSQELLFQENMYINMNAVKVINKVV